MYIMNSRRYLNLITTIKFDHVEQIHYFCWRRDHKYLPKIQTGEYIEKVDP